MSASKTAPDSVARDNATNAEASSRSMTPLQQEAVRQLTVCNACRFCEGLCAVFPALELRRQLTANDADYLANLCHSCGACHYDCQYAPPHEFAIGIPAVLGELREETYARHAWPQALSGTFKKNGMLLAVLTAIIVTVFLLGFILFADREALFATGTEPGAFYRAMPHNMMVLLFGSAFVYAIAAITLSVRKFWTSTEASGSANLHSVGKATAAATQLTYLDGGGMGCMHRSESPSKERKIAHHFTFYGFLLCLASTTSGTFMHYVMGVEAPYPILSPTVILGTLGGIGLIIGPLGLLRARRQRDDALAPKNNSGMSEAFLVMLLLTSVTGLLLLVFRSTAIMGILLAVHLGVVFALFITLPYGKFLHGLYRYAALMRHSHEQKP